MTEKWDVDVCEETARVRLRRMWFSCRQFSKGIDFDGNERKDVVMHKKEYLTILTSHQHRMIT